MWKALKIGCGGICAVMLVLIALARFSGGGTDTPNANPGRIARFPVRSDSVVMDYRRREIRVYADAPGTPSAFSGDTTYVWAFFTNAFRENGESSWSDQPVPVIASNGKIAATLGFHWASNPDLPRDGWRAFVFAGNAPDGVQMRAQERDKNPALSVPGISR